MARCISLALAGLVFLAAAPTSPGSETSATQKGAAWPRGGYGTLDALPDWGGVWVLSRAPAAAAREQPRLKGKYRTHFEAWQKEVRENNGVARRETSNCMPPGMPRMMGTGQYPLEFLFTPGRVTVLHEAWMQWRTIFIDGRPHPDDWDGGIFGHSTGHWEGQTLVVETIGIATITEMAPGVGHSDRLRIVERFGLEADDPDTLLVEMTLEDPEALEMPFRQTFAYRRERDWNLMEFICAENDRDPVDAAAHQME